MRAALAVLGASAIALAACGGSKSSSPAPTAPPAGAALRIAAKVADYSIRLDREIAPHGAVAFDVRNDGRVEHEFLIVRSNAEGAAGTVQAAAKHIGPGRTVTLTATLRPGRYVLICNLRGHYARGMRATFRVT